MIYGFVLMFLVVVLLFTWLEKKIEEESKQRENLVTNFTKLHNKVEMLESGLEAEEYYDNRYVFPKKAYRFKTIKKINEDIKRLHDYLGVKLEPSKTEPERLVKVKKEKYEKR